MRIGPAWAAAVLALGALAGCREERPSSVWMPPLLTEADLVRYERAQDELNTGGKTPEELRTYLGVEQREVTAALGRTGFTPAQFLEIAQTVFLARHGRRVFVDLPEERKALAAGLLEEQWTSAQAEKIKDALRRESQSEAETSSLIERILANAAVLEAYEAKKPKKPAGA